MLHDWMQGVNQVGNDSRKTCKEKQSSTSGRNETNEVGNESRKRRNEGSVEPRNDLIGEGNETGKKSRRVRNDTRGERNEGLNNPRNDSTEVGNETRKESSRLRKNPSRKGRNKKYAVRYAHLRNEPTKDGKKTGEELVPHITKNMMMVQLV